MDFPPNLTAHWFTYITTSLAGTAEKDYVYLPLLLDLFSVPCLSFCSSLPGQSHQSAQLPHTHHLCSEPGMVVNRQIPPISEAADLLLPLSESLPSLVLPLLGHLFGRKSPSPHCTRMRFLPMPRMVPLPHFPKPCLEEKKITVLRQGFLPSSSQF